MQFFAQPYDIEAKGFYFETVEEYEEKAKANRNNFGQPVEEYELQFIGGDSAAAHLASVVRLYESNLQAFIDACEADERTQAAIFYCVGDLGDDLAEMVDIGDDLANGIVYESDSHEERAIEEYAEEYVESYGLLEGMPENLRYYFDFKAFARDMRLGGDVSAFTFCGTTYLWDNHQR